MRSAYKFLNPDGTYFITSTIVEWIPVFTSEKYFKIVVDCTKYAQRERGLKCHAYVILDDHFHMVVSGPDISETIRHLKGYSARTIIDELIFDGKNWLLNQFNFYKKQHKLKSDHQVWQEGSHPQEITSSEILNQKIDYIHFNPVKRGFVEKPEHWRYSSAAFYLEGVEGEIRIDVLG